MISQKANKVRGGRERNITESAIWTPNWKRQAGNIQPGAWMWCCTTWGKYSPFPGQRTAAPVGLLGARFWWHNSEEPNWGQLGLEEARIQPKGQRLPLPPLPRPACPYSTFPLPGSVLLPPWVLVSASEDLQASRSRRQNPSMHWANLLQNGTNALYGMLATRLGWYKGLVLARGVCVNCSLSLSTGKYFHRQFLEKKWIVCKDVQMLLVLHCAA